MLSDWESDLTELSSSEDDYVPKKKKPIAKATGGDYKISNMLKAPRTTTYSARSLYEQILDNTIELDPEYQRDVVWQEYKQVNLIDSILRNYYIPPVIFALTVFEDGTEKRVCIDGKQRLTSLQLFMDGIICHKDSQTNKRYYYKDAPGSKRLLLPKQLVNQFANKQIVCVEYEGLAGDQEREIFQRVQNGVALTPAERMRAHNGPWSDLIREIQNDILGAAGFDLEWDTSRGRDFQCLASILYLLESYPSTKFPGSSQLDKWLQSRTPIPAAFRRDVLETFKVFRVLAKDRRYNTAFQKPTRLSPVEFTMTGVLIHIHRNELSLSQLSQAIWNMRADVRSRHVDVRSNGKVTKTMFTFIIKGMKKSELKNKSGDLPASDAVGQMDRRAAKRKRADVFVEETDSEDDVPLKKAAPKARKSTVAAKKKLPASDAESPMDVSEEEPPKKATTKKASTTKSKATAAARPSTKAQVADKAPAAGSKSVSSSKTSMPSPAVVPKASTSSRPAASSPATRVKASRTSSTELSLSTTAVATESPAATPRMAPAHRPSPLSLPIPRKSSAATPSTLTSPISPATAGEHLSTPVTAQPSPALSSANASPRPPSVIPTPVQEPAPAPPVVIKQEPDTDTSRFGGRLAAIRAARARIGGGTAPQQPPSVPAASAQTPIVVSQADTSIGERRDNPDTSPTQPTDGVLDGLPPLTSERPRLPAIDTSTTETTTHVQPASAPAAVPAEPNASTPFTQENLNRLLELNGLLASLGVPPPPSTSTAPAPGTGQPSIPTPQQHAIPAAQAPANSSTWASGAAQSPIIISDSPSPPPRTRPPPPRPFAAKMEPQSPTMPMFAPARRSPLPDIPGLAPPRAALPPPPPHAALPPPPPPQAYPPVRIKREYSPVLLASAMSGARPAPNAPRRMAPASQSLPSISCAPGAGPRSAPAGGSASFDFGRARERSPGRGRLRTADWGDRPADWGERPARSRSRSSEDSVWSRDRRERERSGEQYWRGERGRGADRERERGRGWYRERERSPEPSYGRRGRGWERGRGGYRGRRP